MTLSLEHPHRVDLSLGPGFGIPDLTGVGGQCPLHHLGYAGGVEVGQALDPRLELLGTPDLDGDGLAPPAFGGHGFLLRHRWRLGVRHGWPLSTGPYLSSSHPK